MTLSAFGPYWYTPNAYAEGIFSLTRNQVGSRVFTPMVVHAVHRSLLGYFSRANSASFCTALVLSAIGSLAIFCSFFRHAVSVARFWRGEGSGGSRSAPLDPASRARAVEDPRAQTGPRRIRSRAEKWSVEDPASRCSDGRTWFARGWLAVRAGFGCDSLRFSIERPSVFHWIFTTVSCREARRQQLWRSSAGGQHSTPVQSSIGPVRGRLKEY